MSRDIALEIREIFNNNQVDDLKRHMAHRQRLNACNHFFIYSFHFVQSAGILTTTIAAGSNNPLLVWVGVGLNLLASLIHVYEKTNESISKKLLKDIIAIKNGTYTDEGMISDDNVDKKKSDKGSDKNGGSETETDSVKNEIITPMENENTTNTIDNKYPIKHSLSQPIGLNNPLTKTSNTPIMNIPIMNTNINPASSEISNMVIDISNNV